MQDCIFCKIVNGEIPSAKIFESEGTFAFLDIAPVSNGHALVIPKKHYPTLWEVPQDLAAELLQVMQKVGQAIMHGVNASGLNIGMNNYRAAGQLVDHAHWHLIPRQENDGLSLWPQGQYPSTEVMNNLAQEISNHIS